ncbi:MYND-type domain-containing protein [Mycena sanguinolenta]|uniref:MYND-type domain-containing protein n=1 Tax=Mycena sanguinolenta TaxID=230812 RepID=A0A8H6YEK8_9AGAR|nr:MYND-type domain-containing protein [Mycena sanguinolenta]
MEALGSAFARLPYFNPLMMVNRSETCAATKLAQCRFLGVNMNDISEKFQRGPDYSPDLTEAEWRARKAVIEQLERLRGRQALPWVPILSKYEIARSSAKKERDWGHLLFINGTTTRYLLVMIFPDECQCGNFSHHDYDALTKYHANKLLCLAKYIWHTEQPPNWIRATYLTPASGYTIPPAFVRDDSTALAGLERCYHIDVKDVIPSLTLSEVERIDAVLKRSEAREDAGGGARRINWEGKAGRAGRGVEGECRPCLRVLYVFASRLDWTSERPIRFFLVGRCKLVQYCSKECQAKAWPAHKHFCKKPAA